MGKKNKTMTLKLKRGCTSDWMSREDGDSVICCDGIRELVDVPDDVTSAYLVASEKQRGTLMVEYRAGTYGRGFNEGIHVKIPSVGWVRFDSFSGLDEFVMRAAEKGLHYFSFWYDVVE